MGDFLPAAFISRAGVAITEVLIEVEKGAERALRLGIGQVKTVVDQGIKARILLEEGHHLVLRLLEFGGVFHLRQRGLLHFSHAHSFFP